MTRTTLAVLCCLTAVGIAHGGPVWGEYYVGGTACNYDTLRPIQSQGRLYVDFDAFTVNMPEGRFGDGLTVRKTCNVRVKVTPPDGYTLVGLKQVYRGGVLKSEGSRGLLNIRYNVGTVVGRALPITFASGTAIDPEDDESYFEKRYINDLTSLACGESSTYGLNLTLTATRDSIYEHLLADLDQMDSRLIVIPEFAPCLFSDF